MIEMRLGFAVLAATSLVACGSGISGDEIVEQETTTTNVEPGAPSTTDTDETSGKELIAESGFSSGAGLPGTSYSTVGALVTNPNNSLAAYGVTAVFNLLDDAGDVLITESVSVPYIPAGATVPVAPMQSGFNFDEAPADMSVDITGKFAEDKGWD